MKNGVKNAVNEYTIIIGCGRLGSTLANRLSELGGSVLIIDMSKDAFRKLSPSFSGIKLVGDATNLGVLHEAEIERAGAVVSVTNNDNVNILLAQMARDMFRVPHVIAHLGDPERECVYAGQGINTLSPADLSIREMDKLLNIPGAEEGAL